MDMDIEKAIMVARIEIFCDADARSEIKDAERYAPSIDEIDEVMHG